MLQSAPRTNDRNLRVLCGLRALCVSLLTQLRAGVQDPEARHVGGAVRALHVPERGDAGVLLARVELRFAEAQLRIVGTLQAALLDALLHERDALVRLAFVDVVLADL